MSTWDWRKGPVLCCSCPSLNGCASLAPEVTCRWSQLPPWLCPVGGGHSPCTWSPAVTLCLRDVVPHAPQPRGAWARDGPWESSMRRFNFVHVFQHKPYLSVGVSSVAQTCFMPCLEEIRRSALAFPECHQAQQSCADPDRERDISKILTDFLSPC